MNVESFKIGQTVRYIHESSPHKQGYRGRVVAIFDDWKRNMGQSVFDRIAMIERIEGKPSHVREWFICRCECQHLEVVSNPVPTEEVVPTSLKPAFAYMKDLGL